jgi:cytochrome c
MKRILTLMTVLFVTLLLSCGGKKEKKKEAIYFGKKEAPVKVEVPKETQVSASKRVDLTNKGIGPITAITLDAVIDQKMATHGADVYKKMCTAIHFALIGSPGNKTVAAISPFFASMCILI